ncbi:CYB protein, partial [Acromyrmex charruanus]
IIRGLFLSIYYCICIYLYIRRNIYYNSFNLTHTLHSTGSSNPTGINRDLYKTSFHPYFTFKDLPGFIITLSIFLIIILQYPYILGDPDNFTPIL